MKWYCVSFSAVVADDEFWMVDGWDIMETGEPMNEEDILLKSLHDAYTPAHIRDIDWAEVTDHEMVDKLDSYMVEERSEFRASLLMAGHEDEIVELPKRYCVSRQQLTAWLGRR